LWNNEHVEDEYDPGFFPVMERYIARANGKEPFGQ
jgi:hypothetical protein